MSVKKYGDIVLPGDIAMPKKRTYPLTAAARLGLRVTLATGEQVKKSEFDKLSEKDQHNLKTLGIEKYNVLQEIHAKTATKELKPFEVNGKVDLVKALRAGKSPGFLVDMGFSTADVEKAGAAIVGVSAREKAIASLKKYEVEGPLHAGIHRTVAYNIDRALSMGVTAETLEVAGFAPSAIVEAQVRMEKPTPTEGWEGFTSPSVKSLEHKYPAFAKHLEDAGLAFSLEHLQKLEVSRKIVGEADAWKIVRDAIAEAKAKGLEVPTERELFTAWGKGIKEYKKWIISLPMGHPERAAVEHRALKAVAFVGTIVAPLTWAGVGRLGTLLPAIRHISLVVRAATALAQVTISAAPIVYTAASITSAIQMGNLEKKWTAFAELPEGKRDYWAKKAGFKKYDGLRDEDKAKILLHYSVPPGYTTKKWSEFLMGKTEAMNRAIQEGAAKLADKIGVPAAAPVVFSGGVAGGVVEGVGYLTQLPILAATLLDEVPEGKAEEFATMVAMGMALFFTKDIPDAFKRDPVLAAGRMVGLFVLTPKALVKYAKGMGVKLHPSFVPKRAIAQTFSTIRIEQVKNPKLRLTPKEMMSVVDQLNKQLLAGKAEAVVLMKGGRWKATVLSVPYQTVVRNSVFHFTPDVTRFKGDIRVSPRKLFGSPQAAIQFGIQSALRGERMKHPGVIEIHLPPEALGKFKAFKVLGKGWGELEVPIGDKVKLSPVPGPGGKGISFDLTVGSFPILRYTLASAKGWLGPTTAQLMKVRVESARAALGDLVLGWYGRKMAIKRMLGKDPRVAKIEKSIRQLRDAQPELIGEYGEIVRQRAPVPHPTKPGLMRSRVTGVVTNPDTGALLLVKATGEKAYGLPGGRVDIHGEFGRGPRGMTSAGALHGQIKHETGIGLTGTEYLGMYLGKLNEYALSGSRVFTAKGKTAKISIRKYGDLELTHAFWWDGKSSISVYPATFDILKGIAKKYKLDMSKVSIYKGDRLLMKARDTAFAKRVETGKRLSETNIRTMNLVEIKNLQRQRAAIIKGEPLTVKEFLEAEPDFTNLIELLEGRRKAAVVSEVTGRMATSAEAVIQRAGLWQKYLDAVRKLKGERRSRRIAELYDEAIDILLDKDKGHLRKVLEDAREAAYYENAAYYQGRYSRYYYKAVVVPIARTVSVVRTEMRRAAPETLRTAYAAELTRYKPVLAAYKPYAIPYKPPKVPYYPPYKAPPYVAPKLPPVPPKVGIVPPVPKVPVAPPPPPGVRRIPRRKIVSLADLRLSKREELGLIAWKQGWCYRCLWPPYGRGNMHVSRKPLAGVKYHEGIGSVQASIIAKWGKIPPVVRRDMGIMDIEIFTPQEWYRWKRKPKIRFKLDRKQRTTVTPGVSTVRR